MAANHYPSSPSTSATLGIAHNGSAIRTCRLFWGRQSRCLEPAFVLTAEVHYQLRSLNKAVLVVESPHFPGNHQVDLDALQKVTQLQEHLPAGGARAGRRAQTISGLLPSIEADLVGKPEAQPGLIPPGTPATVAGAEPPAWPRP